MRPGDCGGCLRPDWRFWMSCQRQYAMELRERVTRMVLEARADPARRKGAIERVGDRLGAILRCCVPGCVPWSRVDAMSAARSVIKRPASGRWKLRAVNCAEPMRS